MFNFPISLALVLTTVDLSTCALHFHTQPVPRQQVAPPTGCYATNDLSPSRQPVVLQDPGTSTGDSATNCNLPNQNSAIHCAFTFAAKTRGKRERIASPAHRGRVRARRGGRRRAAALRLRPSPAAESSCNCTGSVFTLMAARVFPGRKRGWGLGGVGTRIKIYPRPQLMNGEREEINLVLNKEMRKGNKVLFSVIYL